MKRMSLTMSLLMVVTVLSVLAAAAVGKTQTNQDQNQQLEQIGKYVSQRRQAVEDYYAHRLTELRLRAKRQIRLLEVVNKPVYSSLAAQTQLANTVLDIEDPLCTHSHSHRLAPANRRTLRIRPSVHRVGMENTLQIAPKRFVAAQTLIAQKTNRVHAKLEWQTRRLEKQKRYALTTGLAQFEKRLKQGLLKGEPQPTYGAVTGIVYSSDNPSAIIDGKIVHEQDKIHGVRIVKIDRQSVEFEKNGQTWKQNVRQTAEEFWQ